jgi:hypothetical protein
LLDLLLRGSNDGMRESLAKVHCHQRYDLHGLAGTGRLFDEHVVGCAAHVENQLFLIAA